MDKNKGRVEADQRSFPQRNALQFCCSVYSGALKYQIITSGFAYCNETCLFLYPKKRTSEARGRVESSRVKLMGSLGFVLSVWVRAKRLWRMEMLMYKVQTEWILQREETISGKDAVVYRGGGNPSCLISGIGHKVKAFEDLRQKWWCRWQK